MLTGDKFSTAKQIALSCALITSDSDEFLFTLKESSDGTLEECLDTYIRKLDEYVSFLPLSNK